MKAPIEILVIDKASKNTDGELTVWSLVDQAADFGRYLCRFREVSYGVQFSDGLSAWSTIRVSTGPFRE